MKRVLFLSSAVVLSLAVSQPVQALTAGSHIETVSSSIQFVSMNDETLKGAETFIGSVAERGIGFLGNQNLSHAKRKASFKKLLKKNFDIQTIARFALGRYWKTATPAQRKEYTALFEKMIIDVYSSRFGEYNGEVLKVRGSRPEGKRDILVNSVIIPNSGAQEIQLDWRVRYKNGQYRVVDVIVEGVSMAVTQRSDFASVIQRGGGQMDVLLAHLREQ